MKEFHRVRLFVSVLSYTRKILAFCCFPDWLGRPGCYDRICHWFWRWDWFQYGWHYCWDRRHRRRRPGDDLSLSSCSLNKSTIVYNVDTVLKRKYTCILIIDKYFAWLWRYSIDHCCRDNKVKNYIFHSCFFINRISQVCSYYIHVKFFKIKFKLFVIAYIL